LQIHIHDNGPGIPEEYLSTLFDPFVTHKAHGTGLGLSITENIAKQHGGTITVHTCTTLPDTYTDFCLSLPVLQG
jgi:nitrogen-specific signal transduction histidine kinase